jgi:endonuclease III
MCPPKQVLSNSNRIEYSKPGEDFTNMAKGFLQVMNIFLISLDDRNLAPLRWNWDYELLKACDMLESTNISEKLLMNMTCLILSKATQDKDCINGTAELKKKGLLTINALADAKLEDIQVCIRGCGIDHKRSKELKDMAITVRDKYNGMMPSDMEALMAIYGVGRKSSLLMITEMFGFFTGLPPDKHVNEAPLAYKLVEAQNDAAKITPEQAEASLRTWIDHHRLPSVNKIFGSFAQLFTNKYKTVNKGTSQDDLQQMMAAMNDYLHKPMHLEFLWCAIKLVRCHYRAVSAAKVAAGERKAAKKQL